MSKQEKYCRVGLADGTTLKDVIAVLTFLEGTVDGNDWELVELTIRDGDAGRELYAKMEVAA